METGEENIEEYMEGVRDEAAGLPLECDACEARVGEYASPKQIAAYFRGRRDRSGCPRVQ